MPSAARPSWTADPLKSTGFTSLVELSFRAREGRRWLIVSVCVPWLGLLDSQVESALSTAVKSVMIQERFSKCQKKVVSELILFYFLLLFLSTSYPIADLIDFSCADLFIRLIYSLGIYLLFIRQTGDRARQCAKPWLCKDQSHRTLSCSQPSGRGKSTTEQSPYAGQSDMQRFVIAKTEA